jgi:hypothetical protein
MFFAMPGYQIAIGKKRQTFFVGSYSERSAPVPGRSNVRMESDEGIGG